MVVWRGWGPLVVVILVATGLVNIGAQALIMGPLGPGKFNPIVLLATLAAGCAATWFVGRAFNRPLEEAGVSFSRRHSFFFIPIEWWSVPYAVLFALALVGMSLGR